MSTQIPYCRLCRYICVLAEGYQRMQIDISKCNLFDSPSFFADVFLPIIETSPGSSRRGQTSRAAKWHEHLESRPWLTRELTFVMIWASVMPLFDKSFFRNQQLQGRSVGSAIARCRVPEMCLSTMSYIVPCVCVCVCVSTRSLLCANNCTCRQSAICNTYQDVCFVDVRGIRIYIYIYIEIHPYHVPHVSSQRYPMNSNDILCSFQWHSLTLPSSSLW